jgi:hypothetical protein
MAENLLVPAIVHFNLGSKKLSITDYQMVITIGNGCQYIESIDSKGRRAYALQKGGEIVQEADIKVSVLKTPDKKFDDEIKKLEDALQATMNNDPKKYVEDMLFSFATSYDKPFAHMKFQGYVSEITTEVDAETALQEIIAEIEIYDPTTFNIKK